MMASIGVFIDGGYFEKVQQHELNRVKVDFAKLAQRMAGNDELFRTYYYHCLPYKFPMPTQDESERFSQKEKFFNQLTRLPHFEVRLGRLVKQGSDRNGKLLFIQKRVDIQLGIDMVYLSLKGRINRIALFSGDSDFIPAIELLKNEGILISLWHGDVQNEKTAPSRELFNCCDERYVLTSDMIKEIMLD
jgi:uncharacterized LabA/DUF88 family protein